jgi:hypothetical protein
MRNKTKKEEEAEQEEEEEEEEEEEAGEDKRPNTLFRSTCSSSSTRMRFFLRFSWGADPDFTASEPDSESEMITTSALRFSLI